MEHGYEPRSDVEASDSAWWWVWTTRNWDVMMNGGKDYWLKTHIRVQERLQEATNHLSRKDRGIAVQEVWAREKSLTKMIKETGRFIWSAWDILRIQLPSNSLTIKLAGWTSWRLKSPQCLLSGKKKRNKCLLVSFFKMFELRMKSFIPKLPRNSGVVRKNSVSHMKKKGVWG